MTVISADTCIPRSTVDTHIPLLEWEDWIDVVLDPLGSNFDGECTQHDGCRSIL
ncbi:hypothetical protein FB472_2836 [Rhodoglobus vestalii]|uniref:Uncharacterized protein n=1 Tax=Rhodoglobus vestalii TaxID=193384 RepID=A0A8H2K947_9MICO|nr:hypothetical protein [Rhodoglobus vestalii]TQO21162.1 hypothetical protein FB472_2836 [Rhodoglobus vestalii]